LIAGAAWFADWPNLDLSQGIHSGFAERSQSKVLITPFYFPQLSGSRTRFLPKNSSERLVGSIAVPECRQMREYQAYVIGEDGHIQQRIDLVCVDDDAAKERAETLVDDLAIELWELDRKIATFEPDPLKTEKTSGWLKSELRPPK